MTEYKVKSKNQIINDILINILTNVEDVTDANVGSVLRTLVEAIGLEISDLYEELDVIYKGTRIDEATGSDLENLGKLLGISRKEGTKSQGYVTFIRRTPSTFDFIIPSGTIISTQPNTAEEQLRFNVKNNTTFYANILDEEHKFLNGLYDYKFNERFVDSIQSLDGTYLSAPRTFILDTDYQLVKSFSGLIVNPNTVTLIDNCDATTGWNASSGATAISVDDTDYKQGTGSLMLGKSTTTLNEVYYDKVLGSVIDGSNKNCLLWLKIKDNEILNKINYIKITVGSGGDISNSYSLKFYQSNLKTGWNMIKTDFTLSTVEKSGFPNKVAFNYIRFTIHTNNSSDTLDSGDIKMDYWIFAQSEDYEGDIVRFLQTGTLPDDNTNFYMDYKPLSKEVLCQSENNGKKYNIGKHKITYKVSFISNIDSVDNYLTQTGGTDIESDDDLRNRIQNATELKGKATAEALRQAVLGVEGVTSVSVDDMPFKTKSGETHTYINWTSTPSQKLDYEVCLDNSTLTVNGIRGGNPVTFTKYVDYYMQDSIIYWVSSSTAPDEGTNFSVTYDYRWLGHVNMFVAGTSTPLASEVVNNINNVIYDTRAAGIDVTWAEPSIVVVDVTCSIMVNTSRGYSFDIVKENVKTALEDFLNSKDTGEDVYIAELIEVIMGVEGVLNCAITIPATDVDINVSEVARCGSVVINQL